MASFHLAVKTIGRSAGRSATAAAAYRAGVEIADERWKRAMDAIRESMRVIGSREYIRFYRRDRRDGPWKQVILDLASA